MKSSYFVRACWDAEAQVWYSETDIPGLVIETATLAEFEQLISELAPEMLAANVGRSESTVPVEFSAHRTQQLAVA